MLYPLRFGLDVLDFRDLGFQLPVFRLKAQDFRFGMQGLEFGA